MVLGLGLRLGLRLGLGLGLYCVRLLVAKACLANELTANDFNVGASDGFESEGRVYEQMGSSTQEGNT